MKFITGNIVWILALFLVAGCSERGEQADGGAKEWALVLHGGAGVISENMPDSVKQSYLDDLDEALTIGEEILRNGGSALDAVEKVINYLEDNPKFNAGKGSVFTHEGSHELDAAFMLGNTREAGTITGVTTVKNPISLARLVMENSEHVMFAAEGAERYADQTDLERVNQDYFYTDRRYESWKRAIQSEQASEGDDARSSLLNESAQFFDEHKYGTVGCVALDREGRLVAGTSTGGMTNKKFGRVGDVPIIGSGTYASDVVAVSMTGWGEKIMRAVSGHTVSSYMKFRNASLEEAGRYLLEDVLEPGDAGMIAVDKNGNMLMDMNTQGMFRAKSDSEDEREVAIWD